MKKSIFLDINTFFHRSFFMETLNTIHVPRNKKFFVLSTSKNLTTRSSFSQFWKESNYNKTIICINKPITYFIKRNMMLGKVLNRLTKRDRVINRSNIINTESIMLNNRRNFAIYNTYTRCAEPKKLNPHPPMSVDPKTNYDILHPIDYSGKNHIFLVDIEFKSEDFYLVLGSFTSSSYPFAGKLPIYISDINLHGETKKQYFHYYATPRLTNKSDVCHDDLACFFLPDKKTLESILEKARKALS